MVPNLHGFFQVYVSSDMRTKLSGFGGPIERTDRGKHTRAWWKVVGGWERPVNIRKHNDDAQERPLTLVKSFPKFLCQPLSQKRK